MADTVDVERLKAMGLTDDAIASIMGFDLAKYQADYQASAKAAEDARARGLVAAQATGLSDRYVAVNDPRANDLIPGINEQIMGRLGLIPQSYDYAPVFNIKGDQEYENYDFVPVPGKTYRLVDNNTGEVIGTATNAAEAKGLAEAANAISQQQGGNANWALQEYGSWSDGKGNMTSGYSNVYTNEKTGVMNDLKPLIQAAVVMAAVGTGLAAVTAPAAGAGAGAGAAAGAGAGAGAGAAGTGSLVSSSALASSTAANLTAISNAAASAASAAGLSGASTSLLADVALSALRGGLTSAAMGGDPLTGALTAGLGELGSQVVGPLIQSQEVGRIGAGGNFILDGTREATRIGSALGTAAGSAAGSLITGGNLRDIALTGTISGLGDYLTYRPEIEGEQLVGGVNQGDLDTDLLDISDKVFSDLKDTGVFSSMNTRVIDEALDTILVNAAQQTQNTLGTLFTNAGTDALSNALTGSDNIFVSGEQTTPGGTGTDNITVTGIGGTTATTSPPTEAPTITVTGLGNLPTTAPTTAPTTQAPTITVTAQPTTAPTTAPTTQAPTITVTAQPTTAPTTAPTTQAPTITVTAQPTTAPTTAPTTQAPTITVTAQPTTAPTTSPTTQVPTYPTYEPTRPPTWGTKDWVMLGLAVPNLINRIVGRGEDVGTITPDRSAVTYTPLNRERGIGSFNPFTYGQAGAGNQTAEFEFFKPYTTNQPEQKATSASVTWTPGENIYEYDPEEFSTMQQNAAATYNQRSAAFNNYQQELAKQVESGAMTLAEAQAAARSYAEPFGGAIMQSKAEGGLIAYKNGGRLELNPQSMSDEDLVAAFTSDSNNSAIIREVNQRIQDKLLDRFDGDRKAANEFLRKTNDPLSVLIGYADGGEADDDMVKHLMEYRKGGGHHGPGQVKGIGSGQEDKIPAWLSDGEYVWSAQDVADLGDGSTDEGVRRLDKMRQMVRKQAGRKDVKKIAKPQKGIDQMLKAVGGKI